MSRNEVVIAVALVARSTVLAPGMMIVPALQKAAGNVLVETLDATMDASAGP